MSSPSSPRESSATPDGAPAASRTPSYGRVTLSLLAGQAHTNLLGNVHGGEIMRLADSTAGAVAQRHSGGPAVTAAMDQMAFLHPVQVGDIIRTHGQVNWAGSTSMEIGVRVETEPWNDADGDPRHVASAYFVFVAIDEQGRPRRIPGLRPETEAEHRRVTEARIRREHRLARKQEIQESRRRG